MMLLSGLAAGLHSLWKLAAGRQGLTVSRIPDVALEVVGHALYPAQSIVQLSPLRC